MSQQINLFNPIFMKQKKYFSALTMLQALGMIVVGAALFYGYAVYQVGLLGRQSEETAKRYAAEQNRLTRYAAEFSPQQSMQQLEAEVKRLEVEAAEQASLTESLKSGAIGNETGYSDYMRAFARQVVPGLWLTGFEIEGDGARLVLHGGALSPGAVPLYVQHLNREPALHGKSFAALRMQQPKGAGDQAGGRYVEFRLRSSEADEGGK